ncbi:MAG: hypothetical protein AAB879_02880 [Patescibacteria group bacterium]
MKRMIHPSLRRHDRPLYRDVLMQAFRVAWQEKQYWPLALGASFLLTAGSYDILLTAVNAIVTQATLLHGSSARAVGIHVAWIGSGGVFEWMAGIQAFSVISLLFLAFIVLSVISQGGLVYALGAVRRGKHPTLAEAFRVGGGAFWPVAALNALVLSTLWILRFLMAFPLYLALDHTTPMTWLLYLISFLAFLAISFIVTLIHIFALNAMVLQGTPVAQAIVRGYATFVRHWVVTIETAALLFVAAIAVASVAIVAFFFVTIPLIAAFIAATAIGSSFVFAIVLGIGFALLILAMLSVSSILTQLQYATWTFLYRRIGEGGVVAKIHRWMRSLFGITAVPQG